MIESPPGLKYYYPLSSSTPKPRECDICVYGGTPGGIGAAIQAARMGRRVSLPPPPLSSLWNKTSPCRTSTMLRCATAW